MLFYSGLSTAQSVLDDISSGDGELSVPDLATETIKKISPTKRIFIISNDNNSVDKGDYISLVKRAKIVARAIVAKTSKDGIAGIKILKIHSLSLWNTLKLGTQVQIIRGDDSYFKIKKREQTNELTGTSIESEDDLFDTTNISSDDLSVDENKNRAIKTDNVISGGYGTVSAGGAREGQLNLAWAYQIEDNIFVEGLYGQNVIANFPTEGLDTKLSNLTIRGKYTFSAPFFSYVQPYLGFQILNADSPGAGTEDEESTAAELQQELDDVENLKSNTVIFGVTWLKRLVPGWFVKVDLGSDIMSLGFALEF